MLSFANEILLCKNKTYYSWIISICSINVCFTYDIKTAYPERKVS